MTFVLHHQVLMYSIKGKENKFTVQKDHQYYIPNNAYRKQLALVNTACLYYGTLYYIIIYYSW